MRKAVTFKIKKKKKSEKTKIIEIKNLALPQRKYLNAIIN